MCPVAGDGLLSDRPHKACRRGRHWRSLLGTAKNPCEYPVSGHTSPYTGFPGSSGWFCTSPEECHNHGTHGVQHPSSGALRRARARPLGSQGPHGQHFLQQAQCPLALLQHMQHLPTWPANVGLAVAGVEEVAMAATQARMMEETLEERTLHGTLMFHSLSRGCSGKLCRRRAAGRGVPAQNTGCTYQCPAAPGPWRVGMTAAASSGQSADLHSQHET